MLRGNGLSRLVVVAAIVGAIAMATGCNQQQLQERNVALQKQLEQSMGQNADLQAQNDTLKAQNQSLSSDLDRARQAAMSRPGGAGSTLPARPTRVKPEFGEGVETAQIGETTTITLPESIIFDSGKADLKASSKRVLDKIAAVLNKDYAGDRIRVEGHSDNQPIKKTQNLWDDNWELSCNRGMTVLRYLLSKGVDPKRAYAAGYAFYKPVASSDTAAGRAKNRRVVIVVYPQHDAAGAK